MTAPTSAMTGVQQCWNTTSTVFTKYATSFWGQAKDTATKVYNLVAPHFATAANFVKGHINTQNSIVLGCGVALGAGIYALFNLCFGDAAPTAPAAAAATATETKAS